MSPEKLVRWEILGKFSRPLLWNRNVFWGETLLHMMLINPDSWKFLLFSLFSFNQLLWLFLAPFFSLAQPYYWQVNLRAVPSEQHLPSCEEKLLSPDGFSAGADFRYCRSINSAAIKKRTIRAREVAHMSVIPHRHWGLISNNSMMLWAP